MYWTPNFLVLTQKYRDSIITSASIKRVDDTAGRIIRSILDLSSELHDPWSPCSGQIGMSKISDRIRRDWGSLVTHADQYLNILSSDRTRYEKYFLVVQILNLHHINSLSIMTKVFAR